MEFNYAVMILVIVGLLQAVTCKPCNETRSEQRKTGNATLPGYFEVKCVGGDETKYEKKQCWASTGRCWCVDEVYGKTIPLSHVNPGQSLDCETFGWCESKAKQLEKLLGEEPMPGKPAPNCDEKGNFVASQFYPSTGEKYCVIPDGREISGTRTSPGDKAFDCDKLPACLKKEASVTHLQVDGLFPLGLLRPQCDSEGKYKRLQCHGSTGECWCANPDNGSEIEGSKKGPGEGIPHCAKEAVKILMAGDNNLTPCLKLWKKQMDYVSKQAGGDDGTPKMFVGYYVVTCDSEGKFVPEQCHPSTGHCWCVDKDGGEVPGTLSPPGTPRIPCVDISISCQDEKTRKETQYDSLNMVGMYVPQCESDGKYKLKQCWDITGQCWCVSDNGATVPYTRRGPNDKPEELDCSGKVPPPITLDDEGMEGEENKEDAVKGAEGPQKVQGAQRNEETEEVKKIGVPAYMIIIVAVLVCVLAFVVIGALIYVKRNRDSGFSHIPKYTLMTDIGPSSSRKWL